jgi:hypothetical protein
MPYLPGIAQPVTDGTPEHVTRRSLAPTRPRSRDAGAAKAFGFGSNASRGETIARPVHQSLIERGPGG